MWHVIMHTWAMYSGTNDPKDGVYVTRDAGDTWKQVVDPGLPHPPIGKIDVAVAPSNSKRVYALIQTADQGSVWRSDDGGVKWKVVNYQRQLIGRAGYYIHFMVSPSNADEILLANSSFFQSKDGGKTFVEVPWGGDNHDIWFDPKNANHFGLTNDLGARLTTDHGKTFQSVALPVAQMYHVAVDNQIPYWVYGNRQDNGTMRGPSTAPEGATATRGIAAGAGRGGRGGRGGANADTTNGRGRGGGRAAQIIAAAGRGAAVPEGAGGGRGGRGGRGAGADSTGADSIGGGGGGRGGGGFGGFSTWDHGLGGCESGFTLPDPTDANVVWASCYGNEVTRYDHRDKRARSVSPWIHTLDSPPDKLKYRCHWTPPLAIDPFDHGTVYYGCQVVFKTSNQGQSWSVISPDLSTRDPKYVVSSGGIVEDNLGQFYGEVVFAIAPSEIQRGLLWAGTNDGKVWYTKDSQAGGEGSWVDVTAGLTKAGMPAWGTIRKIEPSHFDPATAYVAVDFHMMDNRKPFIYKTTDFGATWMNVTGDLPAAHPLDYVMAITEGRWRTLDEFQRRASAHRRFVDRRPQDVARRRRLDLRARRLHPAGHRAVGERSPDDRGGRRQRLALRAASGISPGAQRASGDHVQARQGDAAAGPHGDSRLGRRRRTYDSVADSRGLQPRAMGSSLRRAARRGTPHAGAGQPAHLPGAALQQPPDAADHALGDSGRADRRSARAPRHVHRASHRQRRDADEQAARDSRGSGDQNAARRPRRLHRRSAPRA
jgi:hypothetical protein